MNVTVINPFRVTQTGAYTFTMSTADKLEKAPNKNDIKVIQEGNGDLNNAVKEVKLSEDKMSVEVEMTIPFVDQKKYEVTFGKEKGSFVASVGAPSAINITPQQVVINKPTEIKYVIVDEKGMDVTRTIDESQISVDVKLTKGGSYENKKLTLWKVGDTAEATVTYHTWKTDPKTGKEETVDGKATITAVDKSTVTVEGLDKWTIADRVLSWDTDEMKTTVPKGDTSSRIWVRMKTSEGYVSNKEDKGAFSFEPINTATLLVDGEGRAFANREGTEYVKVTYSYFDGRLIKCQYTLPVTVGAEAKATSIVVNPSYVVINKDAGKPTPITAIVKDQYGNDMDRNGMLKAEKLSGSDVAGFALAGSQPADNTRTIIEVSKKGIEGTGIYKLTFMNLTTTVTVSSRDVSSSSADYRMIVKGSNDLDVSLYEGLNGDEIAVKKEGVHFDFFKVKAGLIDNDANAAVNAGFKAIYINGEKFEDRSKLPDYIKFTATGIDFKPLETDGDNYIIRAKAGGYNIKVEAKIDGKDVSMTNYVALKDTTKSATSESYGINKVDDDLALPTTVANLAKVIIKNKVNDKALTTPEKYIKVINKNGAVGLAINLKDGNTYYVDTAAVPSFEAEIAGGKKTVWIVTDALANKQIMLNNEVGYKVTEVKLTTNANQNKITLVFNKSLEADKTEFEKKDNYDLKLKNLFEGGAVLTQTISTATVGGAGKNEVELTLSANLDKNVEVTVAGKDKLSFAAAKKSADYRAAAVAPTVSAAAVDEHNMTITMNKAVKFWKEHTLKDSGATNVFTLVTPTADTENVEVKLTTSGIVTDGATTGDIFVKLDATDANMAGYYKLHTMNVGSTHTTLTNPTVTPVVTP